MDSKSISREGVGVRLPSLAPTPARDRAGASALVAAAEELSLLLFPALRTRLKAATEELHALRAARGGLDEPGMERAAGVRSEVERIGWCLGALLAPRGTDLLGVRHERAGLRWIALALEAALGARLFEPAAAELPLLAAGCARSWELPVLWGWLAHEASRGERQLRWRLRSRGEERWLELEAGRPPADRLVAACRALARELAPRVALMAEPGRLGLRVEPARVEERGPGSPDDPSPLVQD